MVTGSYDVDMGWMASVAKHDCDDSAMQLDSVGSADIVVSSQAMRTPFVRLCRSSIGFDRNRRGWDRSWWIWTGSHAGHGLD
jgi:hypothetical protein